MGRLFCLRIFRGLPDRHEATLQHTVAAGEQNMNLIRPAAAAAILLTAACAPAPADNADAQAPQAAQADASGKPEGGPQQAGEALTPAQLVGRWGDNGDCSKDIVFNADGTFRSYTGGSGNWSLNGDVMTMSGAAGTFQVRVSILNGNQLLIGNPDGTIGISQRC
jgi:hypothetical protein